LVDAARRNSGLENEEPMDLSDCRCVRCGAGGLSRSSEAADDIHRDAVICAACGATYDSVWGVPFIGHFERDDFLGLIEIAANVERDYHHLNPLMLDLWERALRSYHVAADKDEFLSGPGSENFPGIARYNEWLEVVSLTGEMMSRLRGSQVLDVGAGLGIDAYRHVAAGANVTALEFSPFLARAGSHGLPTMRWIGGFSHVLPFAQGSFDFVFANAALHHMRDIPAAIFEMLRVLRPGGYLISTSDPYRADDEGEEVELQVFDRNPDVLLGVNERIPRLAEFLEAIEQHRDYVVPELFTHATYNAVVAGKRHKFISDSRRWDYDADVGMLRRTSGSLAMRIRLQRPIAGAARVQSNWAIRVANITQCMPNQAEAMTKLAVFVPSNAVNAPFPGMRSDKLQLLNGWLSPKGTEARQGYRRARWYLERRGNQACISFEVRSELGGPFTVLLNGAAVTRVSLPAAQWKPLSIDVSGAPIDKVFVMELRLEREPQKFSDGLFSVRRRRIGEPGIRRLMRAARAMLHPTV
jgi:ubiquinone/menaquinone biosynthesis C-methylase UbiE